MAVAFKDLINAPELAALLGVSTTRLRQLVADGVLTRAARGQFALPGATQAYCQHMRDRVLGRSGPAPTAGDVNEQERLVRAKADLAEFELKKKRGEVVDAELVGKWWESIVSAAKTRLLAVPSRAAPLVFGATSLAASQAVIENLIAESLNELSAINPVPSVAGDEGVETSAETDSERVGGRGEISKPRKQRRTRKVAD